jgi:hypothetical protein
MERSRDVQLSEGDIVAVHAALGPADEIIQQGRSVYLAATELASDRKIDELSQDVLDNPAVRGHLGAVLGAGAPLLVDHLRSVDELVTDDGRMTVDGFPLRLASSATASAALVGAIGRISDELHRHGVTLPKAWLLDAQAPGFATARGHLVEGVRLALEKAPLLTRDLLPHITLFAVLAQQAGRLGSASAREFPGLVMVPEPRSALEVAEAVIHEGAHQRLFGLMLTRPILGRIDDAPPFLPSWAQPGAPPWRMEQCFAAFHAYCCLGAVADAFDANGGRNENPYSLLPVAAPRAQEIGDWLVRHAGALQAGGHLMLARLTGRRPVDAPAPAADVDTAPGHIDASAVVRRCGPLTLIARRAFPADLMWVRSELVADGPAERSEAGPT